MHNGNIFINAVKMAIKHPKTFEAPSQLSLASITTGSIVKVCNNYQERFWVTVTSVVGDTVTGKVDNDLVITEDYNYGDIIVFTKDNIYNIY